MERGDEQAQDRLSTEAQWRGVLVWAAVIGAVVLIGRLTPFEPVRDFFDSLGWLTRQALRLAKDLFETQGYLTAFLAPLLENTIFLGALIPGTLVMMLAGLSAQDGLIAFWPALLLAVAGAIIGDTISYNIGRFGWSRLGPETRLARWAEQMREPLLDHSAWLVLSYHFAGYSRVIGPAAAGFMRMPYLRWMVLDYIGVTLWVAVFMSVGYLLGTFGLSLDESDRNVRAFEIVLFVFFLIAVLSVMRAARRRRRRRAEAGHHPSLKAGA